MKNKEIIFEVYKTLIKRAWFSGKDIQNLVQRLNDFIKRL
jgi:hypothetical protein